MTYERLIVPAHDITGESGRCRLLAVLEEHGVAVLSGPWSHSDETLSLDALCRLFALPVARKNACRADGPRSPGYTEYGQTRAIDTGIPNLLEMWRLSDSTMRGIPNEEVCSWEHLARVIAILRATALSALSALELALSAPGELTGLAEGESFEFYGIHYPKELLGTNSDARRQSVHQDSSLITLLPRATHPGLCVELNRGLTPLDPRPSDIIVVSGSALEYVTAGRIPPCIHTVETPRSRQEGYVRTALVFFVSVASDRILRPLTPFRNSIANSRYPAILARDFERERYGQVY
jgi:isopenicillin N synthase-like dioxygenase